MDPQRVCEIAAQLERLDGGDALAEQLRQLVDEDDDGGPVYPYPGNYVRSGDREVRSAGHGGVRLRAWMVGKVLEGAWASPEAVEIVAEQAAALADAALDQIDPRTQVDEELTPQEELAVLEKAREQLDSEIRATRASLEGGA